MANKENWEVSYIDEDGFYHGGVAGGVGVYTANGAVSLADSTVIINGSGVSLTLADGVSGQTIKVKDIDATSFSSIIPASFPEGTSIDTAAQYDGCELTFDGSNWYVTNLYGTAAIA